MDQGCTHLKFRGLVMLYLVQILFNPKLEYSIWSSIIYDSKLEDHQLEDHHLLINHYPLLINHHLLINHYPLINLHLINFLVHFLNLDTVVVRTNLNYWLEANFHSLILLWI